MTNYEVLDAHLVAAKTIDELIDATLQKESICVVPKDSLPKLETPCFANSSQINLFEEFFDGWRPNDLLENASDFMELERPQQAAWLGADGALQRRIRESLKILPSHTSGTDSSFKAFIPMALMTDFDEETIYIPGYLLIVAQEGPEVVVWSYLLRHKNDHIDI